MRWSDSFLSPAKEREPARVVRRARSRCRGLTLFELLLVLALLVVLGGLVAPALSGAFTTTKLSSAADDIQAALADARLQAMERGHPVAFRCQIGGSDFATTTYYLAAEDAPVAEPNAELAEEGADGTLARGTLAEGLVFSEAHAASALDAADTGQRSSVRDSTGWSPSIIFYPDGGSSDALLRIAHEDGRSVSVTLRGLTGVSRKGDIVRSEIPVDRGER